MKTLFDNGLVRLYRADARELPLKEGTVHCCVTSPPYFGLRVYQTDDDRVLGLESSIVEYIGNLVDVFREVKRVLRDDGVLWINMGDSYSGSGKGQNADGTHAAKHGEKQHTSKGTLAGGLPTVRQGHRPGNGGEQRGGDRDGVSVNMPGGNLLGVPWRLALALQGDGWILRDSIVWAKASPMPESLQGWRWEQCRVKVGKSERASSGYHTVNGQSAPRGSNSDYDVALEGIWSPCPGCAKCEGNDGLVLRKGSWRCTSSYELIFMLVKSMGYWADGEAVRSKTGTEMSWDEYRAKKSNWPSGGLSNNDAGAHKPDGGQSHPNGANRRNVWRDIHAEPYPGEHYATFPPDLPRLCIQASTSEQGCCPKCGAQITRVVDRTMTSRRLPTKSDNQNRGDSGMACNADRVIGTLGWRPSCGHQEAPEPCLVLDPFMGTGTTALAAMRLNRRCVGTDLSEEYLQQAQDRLSEQTLPMPLIGGS